MAAQTPKPLDSKRPIAESMSTAGLPVTYIMETNDYAEIYSTGTRQYLDCIAEGKFSVRAQQGGNKNYYSSPRASKVVTITGINSSDDPTLTIQQADNGSVNIQVPNGSVYTFTIEPSTGWKIHSVTYNNSDVTNQLTGNRQFTTPAITSNSTLSVVYEDESSAIHSVKASDVRIQSTSNGVRVLNAKLGDNIRIYNTTGLLQHSVKVDAQAIDIPLANDNVYIIKVGDKTVKLSH